MRVAHFDPTLTRGDGVTRVAVVLVREQRERGVESVVVTTRYDGPSLVCVPLIRVPGRVFPFYRDDSMAASTRIEPFEDELAAFLGRFPTDVLAGGFASSDILLFPSATESFGDVTLSGSGRISKVPYWCRRRSRTAGHVVQCLKLHILHTSCVTSRTSSRLRELGVPSGMRDARASGASSACGIAPRRSSSTVPSSRPAWPVSERASSRSSKGRRPRPSLRPRPPVRRETAPAGRHRLRLPALRRGGAYEQSCGALAAQGCLVAQTQLRDTSARGSRFVERVLTAITTLRMQNRPVLAFLVDALGAWRLGTPLPSVRPPPTA